MGTGLPRTYWGIEEHLGGLAPACCTDGESAASGEARPPSMPYLQCDVANFYLRMQNSSDSNLKLPFLFITGPMR
jgi:hypothetical protein